MNNDTIDLIWGLQCELDEWRARLVELDRAIHETRQNIARIETHIHELSE